MVLEDPVTLAGSDLGSDHAAAIPIGMVAFPIPINRFSGLAYGITAGDRINLIATMEFVDIDTQFQTALPNLSVGVYPVDDFGESPISSNVAVSFPVTTPSIVRGRAEFDSLLEQPFYLVPSEEQRPRLVSQTVLQNIVILHVGNFGEEVVVVEQQIDPATGEPVPPPEPLKPDIITLIVTPQEAVTLNYLLYSKTELTVALRGIGDETFTPTQAVTLQVLLDTYQIPIPSKLPYGTVPSINVLTKPTLSNDSGE
jgi:hypothetical protein